MPVAPLERRLFLEGVAYGLLDAHRPAFFPRLLPRQAFEPLAGRGHLPVVEGTVDGMWIRYDFYRIEDRRCGPPQPSGLLEPVCLGGDLCERLQVVGDVRLVPDLGGQDEALREQPRRKTEIAVRPGRGRQRRERHGDELSCTYLP